MKTVLIVDDNEIDTLINRKILERVKRVREIHSALNGKEAIDLLNGYIERGRPLPDVILLDLNMPVMNGFAFIEKFKKSNLPGKENVSIVIITSSSSPADIQLAKEKGIELYIIKPLTEEKIMQALNVENPF